jgi:Na+/H+ antiporter NhaD/arsenite permease-like protein
VLFFLGILLSIGALQAIGELANIAAWMNRTIGDINIITISIGLSISMW